MRNVIRILALAAIALAGATTAEGQGTGGSAAGTPVLELRKPPKGPASKPGTTSGTNAAKSVASPSESAGGRVINSLPPKPPKKPAR